jgi:hypothetical protein
VVYMLQKQQAVNAIKDSHDQYLASISKGKELGLEEVAHSTSVTSSEHGTHHSVETDTVHTTLCQYGV